MKKQFFRFPESTSDQARNAFWSSIILLVASGLNSIVTFRQASTSGIWQAWTEFGVVALFFVAILTSAFLNRRGRTYQAIGLLIGSFLFTIIARNALTEDLGVFYGLIVIVITSALAFFNLPRITANRVMTASIVLGGLLVLFDLISPAYRQPAPPALLKSLPYVASFASLIFLFLIVQQAWRGSLRIKLLAAFIGITVLATGALSTFVIVTTTNNLRGNLERELTALTVTRANRLGDLLDTQINTLTALAINNSLRLAVGEQNRSYKGNPADAQIEIDAKDTTWRAADAANNNSDPLVRKHLTNSAALNLIEYQKVFPDNAEVFVTDIHGALVGTTNRTSDYYQADETWWQTAYNNGQGAVYISAPQFDDSTGKLGVQFALPIRDRVTGTIIGILRTTYILTPLDAVLKVEIGQTGEADLFIPGETLIQIQDGELETPVPELFKQLQAADQSMLELDYEGQDSVATQALIHSLAGNSAIENLGWVVALHQHRDEAFAPINAQIQGIIIVIAVVILLAVLAAIFIAQLLSRPITQLTATAQEVAAGNLNSQSQVVSTDEIGLLASAFNTMTARLRDSFTTLEDRVAERTQSLELASEVGRSVSQVRSLDVMLKDAAELIRSRFDLYYVQVYLTNQSQTALILQSGTGAVGAELVGRAHQLPLNTASINGRAAMEKHSVVISDATASSTFKPNPLLPDTRSEMAVPLLIGERVVGVLDLQSREVDKLNQDILTAFEALAGQLAIAIQNATFLAQTEQAHAEVEAQAQRLSRANWHDYLDAIHQPEYTGFVFNQNKVIPLVESDQSQLSADVNALTAPIAIAGESVGTLIVEMDAENQSTQNVELVHIVARQVAQQIESLRLLDSAERYRFEAEESSRRLTREGWKDYMGANAAENLSFIYDLKEVRPHNHNGDQGTDEAALTLPLKVRDETVGRLVVQGLGSDDKESFDLATAVAERLGAHIESLRQHDQTQSALAQSEKLFDASSRLAQAADLQGLVGTVVETLKIPEINRAILVTFNYGPTNDLSGLDVIANWWDRSGHDVTPVGTHYPLEVIRLMPMFISPTPVFFNDTSTDERVDATTMELVKRLNLRAVAVLPLHSGTHQIGALILESEGPHKFTQNESRLYTALAPQIATVLENRRQFEQAQKQADRETTLNLISQKIQSATTVEAVLQIAARELGHALGAPMTIAQLSMKDKN